MRQGWGYKVSVAWAVSCLSVIMAIPLLGASNITASRDYVDRKIAQVQEEIAQVAATGSVRSLSYGTTNYWTDATGLVWEVDSEGGTNYVGKVALTNDFQDIDLGALRTKTDLSIYTFQTNYSSWTVFRDGINITGQIQQPSWSYDNSGWIVSIIPDDGYGPPEGNAGGRYYDLSLDWGGYDDEDNEHEYHATRTMTSGYYPTGGRLATTNDMASLRGRTDLNVYDEEWRAILYVDGTPRQLALGGPPGGSVYCFYDSDYTVYIGETEGQIRIIGTESEVADGEFPLPLLPGATFRSGMYEFQIQGIVSDNGESIATTSTLDAMRGKSDMAVYNSSGLNVVMHAFGESHTLSEQLDPDEGYAAVYGGFEGYQLWIETPVGGVSTWSISTDSEDIAEGTIAWPFRGGEEFGGGGFTVKVTPIYTQTSDRLATTNQLTGLLKSDFTSLTNNPAFTNAVVAVSPPATASIPDGVLYTNEAGVIESGLGIRGDLLVTNGNATVHGSLSVTNGNITIGGTNVMNEFRSKSDMEVHSGFTTFSIAEGSTGYNGRMIPIGYMHWSCDGGSKFGRITVWRRDGVWYLSAYHVSAENSGYVGYEDIPSSVTFISTPYWFTVNRVDVGYGDTGDRIATTNQLSGMLRSDFTSLTNNFDFTNAVVAVSPPAPDMSDEIDAITNSTVVSIGRGSQVEQPDSELGRKRAVAIGYGACATGTVSDEHSQSVAVGANSRGDGDASTAIGSQAVASGSRAVAIGYRTVASWPGAVAVGTARGGMADDPDRYTKAMGTNAVAIGYYTEAHKFSIAIGDHAVATNNNYTARPTKYEGHGICIGSSDAMSVGNASIAVGKSARALWDDGVAIGRNADATNGFGMAIGAESKSAGTRSVAIGPSATSLSHSGIALGAFSKVNRSCGGAVAIGSNAVVSAAGAFQLGNGSNPNADTLRFRGYELLNASGKIPYARLPDEFDGTLTVKGDLSITNGTLTVGGTNVMERLDEITPVPAGVVVTNEYGAVGGSLTLNGSLSVSSGITSGSITSYGDVMVPIGLLSVGGTNVMSELNSKASSSYVDTAVSGLSGDITAVSNIAYKAKNQDTKVEVGLGASASQESVAIGSMFSLMGLSHGAAKATGYSVSVGSSSTGSTSSVSIGYQSEAKKYDVAIGRGANAGSSGNGHRIAIGYNAKANADYSIQLGTGANNDPNTVKFFDVSVFSNNTIRTEALDTNSLRKAMGLEKTCAMFIINLNEDVTNALWNTIVLKASTNNWEDGGASQVFYSDATVNGLDDSDSMGVYTTNRDGYNPRRLVGVNLSDYDKPIGTIVLIVSVQGVKGNDGAWLNSENEDLVWVYSRSGDGDGEGSAEEDGRGNRLWRSVAPTRWFTKPPKWAR